LAITSPVERDKRYARKGINAAVIKVSGVGFTISLWVG